MSISVLHKFSFAVETPNHFLYYGGGGTKSFITIVLTQTALTCRGRGEGVKLTKGRK